MTEHQKQRLEEKLTHGYEFHFGEYISEGFSLAQKNLGGFAGYFILYIFIVMMSNFVPVVGAIISAVIAPALMVGFYIVAHRMQTGKSVEFGHFFNGFEDLGQLALTYIVMTLIILLVMSPMFIAMASSGVFQWYFDLITDPQSAASLDFPSFPLWSLIFLLPVIYLGIAYKWAYLFVVFYKLSFWDALEYSRRIVSKNWLIIFLFTIVVGIIAALGALLLLVGVLFTAPAMICAEYVAFADVTGLNEAEEEDISEHLVD